MAIDVTRRPADRVLLVHAECGAERDATTREQRIEEARLLIESAGGTVVETVTTQRERPDPATYVGSGKVEYLATRVTEGTIDALIFNQAISAVQARNLERALGCRVLDRTELILDIFAQRAKTHEGKLQVELARLQHMATRLTRGWTHLERQRGGIGLRGGMGESQLEIDRRLIAVRVRQTRERLARMAKQRATQRARRARAGVFRVAIVGYTNAGKSTLFNRLTRADTLVANKLFATLDTTTRKLNLGAGCEVVVSDTVGFIRDLPHALVAAFKATLEETVEADLLLHVVDAANPAHDDMIQRVNDVLAEIGAGDRPQLMVWNKIDCVTGLPAGAIADADGNIHAVRVSAVTGAGIDELRALLQHLSRTPEPPVTAPQGEAPANCLAA